MKTQEDLYLEYARVITMVREYNENHGTDVKPWECVKYLGMIGAGDNWGFNRDAEKYDFAIAILEGKPVFEDSMLYNKNTGQLMSFSDHCIVRNIPISERIKCLTFTPPKKKRTFMLNGVELSCPEKIVPDQYWYFDIDGWKYYFKTEQERDDVTNTIHNMLIKARDKE